MTARLPHPIPYQGSKRTLAPAIGTYVPRDVDVWFEPFAGSAAMTLWAAHTGIARRYVIADALEPMARLWQSIIDEPAPTARRYRTIWEGQREGDRDYFDVIRERYNATADPVDLLYLVCRCVKNAVRFNAKGAFTQSVDRRRLGNHPAPTVAAIEGVSRVVRGGRQGRTRDWLATTADAGPRDFIYLDPPYLGTTIGRDRRYARQLERETLIDGLRVLGARGVRFVLSYDGMTGDKVYGPPLPDELGLSRVLLDAGVSSQATLSGRSERTIESLYLSRGLTLPSAPCSARRGSGAPFS